MRTNGTSLARPGAEDKQGAGMVRPAPEVLAKPKRRRFSAAYKLGSTKCAVSITIDNTEEV